MAKFVRHDKNFMPALEDSIRVGLTRVVKLLHGRVEANINTPVTRSVGQVIRSRIGEFPRKDTGKLQSTLIVGVHKDGPLNFTAFVGTPLGYGKDLEVKMSRLFLARTFYDAFGEMRSEFER